MVLVIICTKSLVDLNFSTDIFICSCSQTVLKHESFQKSLYFSAKEKLFSGFIENKIISVSSDLFYIGGI